MKNRILNYLLDNGSITSWSAIELFGCTRLSEYIRQIRQQYAVKSTWENTTNRYGDKVKYVRYELVKE